MSRRQSTVRRDAGSWGVVGPSVADETRFFPPTIPGDAPSHSLAGAVEAGEADALSAAIRFLLRDDRAAGAEAQIELLLGRVVNAAQEGLFICDERGLIVYANERFCRILGSSQEDLLLQPASEHFLGMYSQFLEAQNRGQRECHFGVDWRNSSDEARSLRVTGELFESDDRKYLGCYGIVQDLTGRSQTEAALRRSQSESTVLSAQLLAAQEEERQRIARELQDGIGQALGGVKFGLEACAELIRSGDHEAAVGIARLLVTKIQSAVEEVRRISMNLHPSTLDDLGLLATIGWLSREFRAVYQHLDLHTSVEVREEEIPVAAKSVIYRIIQEALNNVVMHAQARNVSLTLRRDRGLVELTIQDDGIGFDNARVRDGDEPDRGLGLASMRDRAEATGGQFTLDTELGRGTTVCVTWPS
jgi:PAS domain S-box-containing protein